MNYHISFCDQEGDYRYLLKARTEHGKAPVLNVIQCNPSTASWSRSDPTVGKVTLWAKEQGFGIVQFMNLFARRSSKVETIAGLPYNDLVGPRNDEVLRRFCHSGVPLICGWGAKLPVPHELYLQRLKDLRMLLQGVPMYRVGAMVRGRYPRHGRMWNKGNREILPLSWMELGI